VVDWGAVCLLAAYSGSNLAQAMGAASLRRSTIANASQLLLPRL